MTKKKFDEHFFRQKGTRRDNSYHQKNEKPYLRQELKSDVIEDKTYAYENFSNLDCSNSKFINVNFESCNFDHAIFQGARFLDVSFHGCQITKCNLDRSNIVRCKFNRSNCAISSFVSSMVQNTSFNNSNLSRCNFKSGEIQNSSLTGANLSNTSIIDMKLQDIDLSFARLINTKIYDSELISCRVFGSSAWKCDIINSKQENIVITPKDDFEVCVDSIESAQAIYMFLANSKIRNFIDSSSKTLCLILGRFTEKRISVLKTIKKQINESGNIAILFDFAKPSSRNFTETVTLLAHLSKIIIADISDPRSIPHELQTIVPRLPSVRVLLIQEKASGTYAMVEDLSCYSWVEKIFHYDTIEELSEYIKSKIADPTR